MPLTRRHSQCLASCFVQCCDIGSKRQIVGLEQQIQYVVQMCVIFAPLYTKPTNFHSVWKISTRMSLDTSELNAN